MGIEGLRASKDLDSTSSGGWEAAKGAGPLERWARASGVLREKEAVARRL